MLGGGGQATTTGGNPHRFVLRKSYPSSPNAWTAEGVVTQTLTEGGQGTVTAYAMCSQ
jgi:hypothetical protein